MAVFETVGKGIWLFALGTVAAHGQALYDAALATPPEAQGWVYLAVGTTIEVATNRSVLIDTSERAGTHAGWAQVTAAPLDRAKGFTLLLAAKINSETHDNDHRAGFSLIVLGDDRRGIELGFWVDTVFAQSDSPLFTHAEEARVVMTNDFVEYGLSMFGTNYSLVADGAPLLKGPVRDYTSFDGFPNPYSTPNFLFMGDDTSSAAASVSIRRVTLIHAPALNIANPGVITWAGVKDQSYTVESSADFKSWAALSRVTTPDGEVRFTNSSIHAHEFYRVVFP